MAHEETMEMFDSIAAKDREIAALKQAVERLTDLCESRKNRIEDDSTGVNGLLQENATLRAENARLIEAKNTLMEEARDLRERLGNSND